MEKITDCYKSDFPGVRIARSSASDLAAITPKRITPPAQKAWGVFISGFRKGLNGLDKLPFPVKKPTLLQKREVGSTPTGNPIFILPTIQNPHRRIAATEWLKGTLRDIYRFTRAGKIRRTAGHSGHSPSTRQDAPAHRHRRLSGIMPFTRVTVKQGNVAVGCG